MDDEEKFNSDVTQSMIDNFIEDKFPKIEQNPDLDYSNPMDAGSQFKALKESKAKKDIGVAETIRRLQSGRKFD